MIDNFDIISSLLTVETEDDFYFAQILQRKKEHPELGSNSHVVKTYFIRSAQELYWYKPEMICLCDFHNARAGINLNRRSFEKIALNTLKKLTDQLLNKDYQSVRKCYASACGMFNNEKNKKWIVDIDHKNKRDINNTLRFIESLEPEGMKFIKLIETKNGFHLITKPFNTQQFKQEYPYIEVHKDNPTILYTK